MWRYFTLVTQNGKGYAIQRKERIQTTGFACALHFALDNDRTASQNAYSESEITTFPVGSSYTYRAMRKDGSNKQYRGCAS